MKYSSIIKELVNLYIKVKYILLEENKTIIEYTLEYTSLQKWNKKHISEINQIRIFKQAILLCELVRMNRKEMTEYFYDINAKSYLV